MCVDFDSSKCNSVSLIAVEGFLTTVITWLLVDTNAIEILLCACAMWTCTVGLSKGVSSCLYALAMLAFIVVASVCALVYIGARAYIVVEAFISVRSLPIGAYDNVSWAQLLVHFQ